MSILQRSPPHVSGAPSPEDRDHVTPNLHTLRLLGAEPEERFDRLTRLARRLFDAPIALLNLADSDRPWFKSRISFAPEEIPRETLFCADAMPGDDVLIVPDATEDERFRNHPMVVDLPEIRFYAGCPVRAPDGSSWGTLSVIDHEPRTVREEDAELLRDLAEMVEQELKSLSLAMMDELTGLTNRRGFQLIAGQTLAMCRRLDRPATLLMFDLDDFKNINDTQGHLAGDQVLTDFADQLRSTFRGSDSIARIGGDEFCVLLSAATMRDVVRPLATLESHLMNADSGVQISFSVGAATYDPKEHESVNALLKDADSQMYRQKHGRPKRRARS